MAALVVDPSVVNVPATGGNSTHQLTNTGTSRLAFKVKSSNNNDYRVKPVYGFVETASSTTLEIIRLNGSAKKDKLVLQYAEVPAEETDAQAPFKAGAAAGEIILALNAE